MHTILTYSLDIDIIIYHFVNNHSERLLLQYKILHYIKSDLFVDLLFILLL